MTEYLASRGDAGSISFNDEASKGLAGGAFWIRIGSCQEEVPVCVTSIGDPHLLAIDDVVVAFLFSSRLQACHIGSRTGLGNAVSLHSSSQMFPFLNSHEGVTY